MSIPRTCAECGHSAKVSVNSILEKLEKKIKRLEHEYKNHYHCGPNHFMGETSEPRNHT